ncbi:MAG: enoyl-CoA hydratase [Desulfuromonadales bacterium]|nr:enoyl-CoA hydratase [Desulfuromonadales bacterium]MBN2792575.1 enoyl-CoA hydratase [Desulfuromonadales bacterium]
MNVHCDEIAATTENGILKLGIHRPEKLNALTATMYAALAEEIENAARDESIRVVVLHGTEDCFTSGNDLADFAENPPQGEHSPVFRFLKQISQFRKPLAAQVSGPAVGIGTTMLLHCDLVYADETAKFRLPFVNLGLCPEAASSYLLPKLVGHLRAAELLLCGDMIDSARAAEIGLVTRTFPHSELEEKMSEKLRQIVQLPPRSVQLTKALLKQNQTRQVAEVMSEEGALFIQQLAKPEAQEAIQAFLQGRKPNFQ